MSEYVNDIFLEALKLHVQILSDCEQTCVDKRLKKCTVSLSLTDEK